jgi:hypothetical protein
MNPRALVGPHFLKMAAFVDYLKAKQKEVIILNIQDMFYLQYNRAKRFNVDTQEDRDQVVVIRDSDSYSELVSGLGLGEKMKIKVNGTDDKFVIKVCQVHQGTPAEPDYVILSVSMNRAYCGVYFKRQVRKRRAPNNP